MSCLITHQQKNRVKYYSSLSPSAFPTPVEPGEPGKDSLDDLNEIRSLGFTPMYIDGEGFKDESPEARTAKRDSIAMTVDLSSSFSASKRSTVASGEDSGDLRRYLEECEAKEATLLGDNAPHEEPQQHYEVEATDEFTASELVTPLQSREPALSTINPNHAHSLTTPGTKSWCAIWHSQFRLDLRLAHYSHPPHKVVFVGACGAVAILQVCSKAEFLMQGSKDLKIGSYCCSSPLRATDLTHSQGQLASLSPSIGIMSPASLEVGGFYMVWNIWVKYSVWDKKFPRLRYDIQMYY